MAGYDQYQRSCLYCGRVFTRWPEAPRMRFCCAVCVDEFRIDQPRPGSRKEVTA